MAMKERQILMGLVYRRRVREGRNAWLNVGRRGVSQSVRLGRVTINSAGRGSVRLFRGVSYRFGKGRQR